MEFRVLGPLLVQGARPVSLGSPKQRALLATLVLEAPGSLVPADRLIDELWGEDPPVTAGKALSVHLSQLRRALGTGQPIVTRPGGYAVELDPELIDVHRFTAHLENARRLRTSGETEAALVCLREGLALWRGPALADVTLLGAGASEAARLNGLRAMAQEERIELELSCGESSSLVPELEALIASNPYREHLHALLMRALYQAGRQADALDTFRRARAVLVEDLGLTPGNELVRLETAVLTHDPILDLSRPATVDRPRVSPPTIGPGVPLVGGSILGRELDLTRALGLIAHPEVRLIVITGAGGIGKTRLAVELARRLQQRFHLVELGAVTDPDRVMPAIAEAVGASDASEQAVAGALADEPTVLFLDNFEQVRAAAPALVSLVGDVPHLTAVVTSRAPLNVAIEHELPLPPLPHDAAVELFIERAQEQDPEFSPDPDDLECIAAICERLDRLPLAIELAAARTRVLTLDQIRDRLHQRLDLLTASHQDAPERHKTLRATIAWSHDLLASDEQRLFAQLSVFASGWSLEAAEAVAARPVLDALSALVEHGLVGRDRARFKMLETVREYASERLQESGDAAAVSRRHALWCHGLAAAAAPELEGRRQSQWFAQLDAEKENLRAASTWAVANGEPEIALELIGALWRFWFVRGAAADVRDLLNAALGAGTGDPALRSRALNAAGVLAAEAGNLESAQVSFEEALHLANRIGDRRQAARLLMNLGVTAVYNTDYTLALVHYRQAAKVWQELGDRRGQSVMLQNVGIVHELRGELRQALAALERSVELARAAGDQLHLASASIELGRLLVQADSSDPRIPDLLCEGLERAEELGERLEIIECLEVLAAFNARTGAPALGAELLGAADAERTRLKFHRKPDESPFVAATSRLLEQELGTQAYQQARARGQARTLEGAVDALRTTGRLTLRGAGKSQVPEWQERLARTD